eukprot:2544713-Pleurochrysis_carterae.AAC.3
MPQGSKAGKSSGPVVGPLALTLENVELVLDEMRPYLMADGGNVAVADIDGGVVRLELQGACGTCPSSTMTMKMGLERGLREKIPEIVEVEQVAPDGPQARARAHAMGAAVAAAAAAAERTYGGACGGARAATEMARMRRRRLRMPQRGLGVVKARALTVPVEVHAAEQCLAAA